MNRIKTNFSVALGIAFFTQALAPLISGAVLLDPLVKNVSIETAMASIARQTFRVQMAIFLDMIAVMVIIFLGALLYTLLKKENRMAALMGFALYTLEAIMLVMSRVSVFALVRTSQLFAASGDVSLLGLGQLFLDLNSFAYNLAMLPFGVGALLFYWQLYRTRSLPVWLMLWGLITVLPIMIGIPLMAFGVPVPFILMVPYVPFEFVAGVYLMLKGLPAVTFRAEPELVGVN
jgi:hypothetical protein